MVEEGGDLKEEGRNGGGRGKGREKEGRKEAVGEREGPGG